MWFTCIKTPSSILVGSHFNQSKYGVPTKASAMAYRCNSDTLQSVLISSEPVPSSEGVMEALESVQ